MDKAYSNSKFNEQAAPGTINVLKYTDEFKPGTPLVSYYIMVGEGKQGQWFKPYDPETGEAKGRKTYLVENLEDYGSVEILNLAI